METTFYLNGKRVKESEILISMKLVESTHEEHYDVSNGGKKLIRTIHKECYETKEYQIKQAQNAHKYFSEQAEMREELNLRHG